MLENIRLCRYAVPTPIQAYCLPSILKGLDIIAVAQTGKLLLLIERNIVLIRYRLRKDSCLSDPDDLKTHGES